MRNQEQTSANTCKPHYDNSGRIIVQCSQTLTIETLVQEETSASPTRYLRAQALHISPDSPARK
jgi:hypothetical protein